MPTIYGYEIIDQTAFRIAAIRSPRSILRADYGEGYADTAMVGATGGTKSFVATAGLWSDNTIHGTIGGLSWFEYYFTFLSERLDNGNEPFVIEWNGGYYLVDLDDPETALDCLRSDNNDAFVPAKIKLNQRRRADVPTLADGSIDEP